MGYSGAGAYSLPPGSVVADGTSADAADLNTPLQDLETAMNLNFLRDGRAAATGDFDLNSHQINNLAAGTAAGDAARTDQVQTGASSHAATVNSGGGTVDAIRLTFSPTNTALTTNERVRWTSPGANTVTTPTLSKNGGTTTKTIKKGASAALAVGDTGASGYVCEAEYNGTDWILLNPATAAGTAASNTFSGDNTFSGSTMLDGPILVTGGPLTSPGGRLTLTSATPVLTSDVTGATTIYYTPYIHNAIDLYDGTRWRTHFFAELSQALADATKSPAAAATDSNYDMFVWNDSGTLRCTRGPVWSSATARGTGAGTTELERLHGVFVNKIAITNGPAAQRGVYVGTIRTNGSTATPMVWKPAAASGGAACTLYVWNNYNRVRFTAVSRDNKDTWNYATGSFRSTDNSTNNRVHIVRGLQVDDAEVMAVGSAGNDLNIRLMVGLGLDSASHHSDAVVGCGCPVDVNEPVSMIAHYRGDPGLGYHYFQALEWGGGSGTTTWRGDNGLEQMQGLFVSVWA